MPEDLTPELLLVRNVALEKEIDSLRTMLNNMAEQRDGFRAHVETLSVEALRLKEESDQSRRQHDALAGQRAGEEREFDAQRTRWASELEQASRQFEDMREQMIPPADLEAMRLRLIEDTEAPWRERCQTLEAELEKARAGLAPLRREAEQHKSALDAASNEHRAQMRELEIKQEIALAEARARADAAGRERGPPAEPTDLERMRRMQRENTEVRVRHEKLMEEIDDLRADNDGLREQREALLQAQAQAQGEARAAAKLAGTERESLQRRAAHLQQELDAANAAHDRLHEGYLRQENEARKLRASLDDAQHGLAGERAAATLRVQEAARDGERLKLEMERRHTEQLRREAALTQSRDELASSAQQQERDAAAQLARVRDEEALKTRRIEAERTRLQEQLAQATSEAAAQQAQTRDRLDGALGEASGLKAELHGAALEKAAVADEAARLRRRCEAADERLTQVGGELHALRLEHTELASAQRRHQEAEAAAATTQERVLMQLEAAQREVRATHARAESSTAELTAKLRQGKRQWAKEKASLRQAEAARTRMVEALRHELERLRLEREGGGYSGGGYGGGYGGGGYGGGGGAAGSSTLLAAAASCHESCCAASGGGGGGGGASSGGGAAAGAGALPAELQRLVSEDAQLQEEVAKMKASLRSMEAVSTPPAAAY